MKYKSAFLGLAYLISILAGTATVYAAVTEAEQKSYIPEWLIILRRKKIPNYVLHSIILPFLIPSREEEARLNFYFFATVLTYDLSCMVDPYNIHPRQCLPTTTNSRPQAPGPAPFTVTNFKDNFRFEAWEGTQHDGIYFPILRPYTEYIWYDQAKDCLRRLSNAEMRMLYTQGKATLTNLETTVSKLTDKIDLAEKQISDYLVQQAATELVDGHQYDLGSILYASYYDQDKFRQEVLPLEHILSSDPTGSTVNLFAELIELYRTREKATFQKYHFFADILNNYFNTHAPPLFASPSSWSFVKPYAKLAPMSWKPLLDDPEMHIILPLMKNNNQTLVRYYSVPTKFKRVPPLVRIKLNSIQATRTYSAEQRPTDWGNYFAQFYQTMTFFEGPPSQQQQTEQDRALSWVQAQATRRAAIRMRGRLTRMALVVIAPCVIQLNRMFSRYFQ